MRQLSFVLTAVLLATLSGLVSRASAQLSPDEAKCQQGTSLAVSKFITDKAKCIIKCEQGARKGLNMASDCSSPFGNATLACVQRAESKAEGLEQSKCAKDCPECYTGGNCAADADARVANAEMQVDGLATLVYCDDSGSGDGLTAAEAKCADTVAKTLSNFAKKKLNCYAKCRKAEQKGSTPPGSCLPATEEKTAECISKEEAKSTALIDKKCETSAGPKNEKPECFGTNTGATWTTIVEGAVDGGQPGLYCASPSGAFVE
jgi:hypothetical protein